MGGNKTNSNSITSILVEKLNNRKSGFRYKMLEKWQLPSDIFFEDGTNRQTSIPDMGNKKVDIIGYSNKAPKVLIEIKAGCRETLQKSQMETGEYGVTAKNHTDIPFFYIIPDKYEHQNNLPVNVKICKWSEIYNIALEYDNTGLKEQIEFFVGNPFSTLDKLLSKGDVIMYLIPDFIAQVLSVHYKIRNLMKEFVKNHNSLIEDEQKKDDLGNFYTIKDSAGNELPEVWIGLISLKEVIEQKQQEKETNIKELDEKMQEIVSTTSFFIWFGFY